MKKNRAKSVREVDPDAILPEYDFRTGVRNPYAKHFKGTVVMIMLDPDVARAFPTAKGANDALRSLIRKPAKRKRARKR